MNFTKLALAALTTLTTTATFVPPTQAAETTPYWLSETDTCHLEMLRKGEKAEINGCRFVEHSFTYNCRKWNNRAGRVTPTKCNSSEMIESGMYQGTLKTWFNREIAKRWESNEAQREADLAAGRTIVPGVPVTPSLLSQTRARDAFLVWRHNATPAERAAWANQRNSAMAAARCRTNITLNNWVYTVDHCTGEVFE